MSWIASCRTTVRSCLLAAAAGAVAISSAYGADDAQRLAAIRKDCGFTARVANADCIRSHAAELEDLYFKGQLPPAAKVEIAAKLAATLGSSEADAAVSKRVADLVAVFKEAERLEAKSGLRSSVDFLGQQDASLFAVDQQYGQQRLKAAEAKADEIQKQIHAVTDRLADEKRRREPLRSSVDQLTAHPPPCPSTQGPPSAQNGGCTTGSSPELVRSQLELNTLDNLIANDERSLADLQRSLQNVKDGR